MVTHVHADRLTADEPRGSSLGRVRGERELRASGRTVRWGGAVACGWPCATLTTEVDERPCVANDAVQRGARPDVPRMAACGRTARVDGHLLWGCRGPAGEADPVERPEFGCGVAVFDGSGGRQTLEAQAGSQPSESARSPRAKCSRRSR